MKRKLTEVWKNWHLQGTGVVWNGLEHWGEIKLEKEGEPSDERFCIPH